MAAQLESCWSGSACSPKSTRHCCSGSANSGDRLLFLVKDEMSFHTIPSTTQHQEVESTTFNSLAGLLLHSKLGKCLWGKWSLNK